MAARPNEFNPQAGFVVTAASDFANFNQQTFVKFYQPVLGPVAFSFFYALQGWLLPQPTLGDRRLQSIILRQLNAGSSLIGQALHRLEAVGLVRTFQGKDSQGTYFVYQLQPTLTPAAFIEDDLLSVLLLEAVGDDMFTRLSNWAHRFELQSQTKLNDVSHQFLTEFHVDPQSIVSPPAAIKDARQQTTVEAKHDNLGQSDFDWAAFNQLLHGQPVAKGDLDRYRRLIEVEHQLYGIDEPTMKDLVLKAVSLSDNHFDATKFKRIVSENFQSSSPTLSSSPTASGENANRNPRLTDKDRLLLDSVSKYAPVDFLQSLKEQTGGYVTASERHILTHLVADVNLSAPVVNILSWYVIAELDNATLKASFVDAIANSWLKAGVHDGESALIQLKEFSRQKADGRKSRRRQSSNRRQVNEKMPEWTKKSQKERTQKASKAEIAAIQQMLAKRKQQK